MAYLMVGRRVAWGTAADTYGRRLGHEQEIALEVGLREVDHEVEQKRQPCAITWFY